MFDWLFVMLLVIAFVLMILSIDKYNEKDYFWAFTFCLICTVLWFLLAASVLEIEQSYTMYNATSHQIESGVSIVTSKIAPEMVYLFQLPGIIMFIFTFVIVFLSISDFIKKRRMR